MIRPLFLKYFAFDAHAAKYMYQFLVGTHFFCFNKILENYSTSFSSHPFFSLLILGNEILVAPVIKSKAENVSVYFPLSDPNKKQVLFSFLEE